MPGWCQPTDPGINFWKDVDNVAALGVPVNPGRSKVTCRE